MFKKFPKVGERVIAPFQLKQNGMSYSWDGVVTRRRGEAEQARRVTVYLD